MIFSSSCSLHAINGELVCHFFVKKTYLHECVHIVCLIKATCNCLIYNELLSFFCR